MDKTNWNPEKGEESTRKDAIITLILLPPISVIATIITTITITTTIIITTIRRAIAIIVTADPVVVLEVGVVYIEFGRWIEAGPKKLCLIY